MDSIYFLRKKGQDSYYSNLAMSHNNPYGLTDNVYIANIYTQFEAEEQRFKFGDHYEVVEEDLRRFMENLYEDKINFSDLEVIEETIPGFIDNKSLVIDKIYSDMESEGIEFDEMPVDIAIQILIEAGISYGSEQFYEILKEKSKIENIYDALLDSGIKVTISDFRDKHKST